ncbi:hypothetical protein JTB14_014785 [Gonioctena quinquepunctata]|nr:hypothetical protein JTB14_014785 [Gonioctena quinquepunctata]
MHRIQHCEKTARNIFSSRKIRPKLHLERNRIEFSLSNQRKTERIVEKHLISESYIAGNLKRLLKITGRVVFDIWISRFTNENVNVKAGKNEVKPLVDLTSSNKLLMTAEITLRKEAMWNSALIVGELATSSPKKGTE